MGNWLFVCETLEYLLEMVAANPGAHAQSAHLHLPLAIRESGFEYLYPHEHTGLFHDLGSSQFGCTPGSWDWVLVSPDWM